LDNFNLSVASIKQGVEGQSLYPTVTDYTPFGLLGQTIEIYFDNPKSILTGTVATFLQIKS